MTSLLQLEKKNQTRALITGVTGFVGSHLAELLLKEGVSVYGLVRSRSTKENIESITDALHLCEGDLADAHSLRRILSDVRPDYVFHLGAQSFVPSSWVSPATTMETNLVGTVHLFEAVASLQSFILLNTCYSR